MTNRDYTNLNYYLDELNTDIYYQPDSIEHHSRALNFSNLWLSSILFPNTRVLDLGCGTGFLGTLLRDYGIIYEGISLSDLEVQEAQALRRNVFKMDFSFLEYDDNYFDVLISRHSLEHSFSAILSLMEWHRVSKKWLALVLPNPEYQTYVGRNHMNVMNANQAAWLLRRAGWKIRKFRMDTEEIWFLCEKFPRISYEGWADVPLSRNIHEFERDMLKHGELDVQEYAKRRGLRELF